MIPFPYPFSFTGKNPSPKTLKAKRISEIFSSVGDPFLNFKALFEAAIESIVKYSDSSPLRVSDGPENFALKTKPNSVSEAPDPVLDRKESLTRNEILVADAICSIRGIQREDMRLNRTIHHYGIDSIAVIQLAARLRSISGAGIMPKDILKAPCLIDVAKLLDSSSSDRSIQSFDFEAFDRVARSELASEIPDISSMSRIRPCTHAQAGMLSQILRGNDIYVNCTSIQFNIPSTQSQMRKALQSLVDRHEMLRTGFWSTPDLRFPFVMLTHREIDLSTRVTWVESSQVGDTMAETWRGDVAQDIMRESYLPAWKAIIENSASDFTLHLSMFHGLYDGNSLRIILKDLGDILKGGSLKQEPAIEDALGVIISHDDVENQSLKEEGSQHFWRSQFTDGLLGESAPTSIPILAPLRTSWNRKEIRRSTCSMNIEELTRACAALESTLQAVAQAAYAEVLSAYVGKPVVTFGVVLSGRDIISNAEDYAFPTMTTVPFPVKIDNVKEKMVKAAMDFNARVREYQFSSLLDIADWGGYSKERLFDTIFAYQQFTSLEYQVPWTIKHEIASDEVTSHDYQLNHADAHSLRCHWNSSHAKAVSTFKSHLMLTKSLQRKLRSSYSSMTRF
jgi:aryl carrier-like protein